MREIKFKVTKFDENGGEILGIKIPAYYYDEDDTRAYLTNLDEAVSRVVDVGTVLERSRQEVVRHAIWTALHEHDACKERTKLLEEEFDALVKTLYALGFEDYCRLRNITSAGFSTKGRVRYAKEFTGTHLKEVEFLIPTDAYVKHTVAKAIDVIASAHQAHVMLEIVRDASISAVSRYLKEVEVRTAFPNYDEAGKHLGDAKNAMRLYRRLQWSHVDIEGLLKALVEGSRLSNGQ